MMQPGSHAPHRGGRFVLAALLLIAGVTGAGCEGDEPAPPIPAPPPPPTPAPDPPTPAPEPDAGQFTFEPSPPIPDDAHWGYEGVFSVLPVATEGGYPLGEWTAVSTNAEVLQLFGAGLGYWRWRILGPGDATVEIRHLDRVVLTHDVQAPLQTHDRHNVMLRAVLVNETWTPFVEEGSGGWATGVPLKESPNLKYVEAVLWEDTRAVHVYEFDSSFDPEAGFNEDLTPAEYTDYRESYRVLAYPGMPLPPPGENSSPEVSRFLRETFEDITSWLVSRYPDSEHHLNYHGHGAAGGRLLEYRMMYDDVNEFLAHWTGELGRPLGVVDMGGPCNKAGYEDVTNFCGFAQYYVASDMPQGGYVFDEWTREKYQETSSELQYHRLFAESEDLLPVVEGRIDLNRAAYEYSRNDMVAKQWPQGIYLHSCSAFEPFADRFIPFARRHGVPLDFGTDVLDYLETNGAGPDLIEAFRRVVIHQVDNRDFFDWAENRNGMTMPHWDWWNDRHR